MMDIKELEQMDIETLSEISTNEETEQAEQWKITDAVMANWAIKKVKEEQERFALYEEVAKLEKKKIDDELNEERRKSLQRTDFLRWQLGEYLEREEVPAKKTKTQMSLNLPAGNIKKKLPYMEYFTFDADKPNNSENLLKFLEDIAPEYIKTEISVNWSELKKQLSFDEDRNVIFNPTGEIIESISMRLKPAEVKVD